jgi:hypothetical protein
MLFPVGSVDFFEAEKSPIDVQTVETTNLADPQ